MPPRLQAILDRAGDALTAKRVFGEPYERDGVAVIPVAAPKPEPRKKRTLRVAREAPPANAPRVLTIQGLVKRFGDTTAVDAISLDVRAGSFYGIVGPDRKSVV